MTDDKKPLVSCCTMTYKKFNYLYDTLNSILLQNYPNIEIVISDDGSPDFPRKEIENYLNNTKKENIVIIVILEHKENQGTVKNYNSAVKHSSGLYILPVSCGDVLYNEKVISDVVERFIKTGWDLISFRRQLCDEESLTPIRYMPTDENINCIHELNTPFLQYKALSGIGSYYEMASGSSTCFRKSFFESFGCFDEDYRLWEDGPFFIRYTRLNNFINTAYDIVYIKYRVGGITTKMTKNSPTSIQLKIDGAKLARKEIMPYYETFSRSERRIIDCNCFCHEHYNMNKLVLGLNIMFRWPELFIKRLIRYIK